MDTKEVLLICLVIFLVPFVNASFELGNLSDNIKESYSVSGNIEGWINISFSDVSVKSNLTTNFGDEINLKELLDLNGVDYFCIPEDCGEDYVSENASDTKSFSLNYGDEKTISFVVDGLVDEILDLSFNVDVNNQPSCIRPLRIDVLDDEYDDWVAKKVTNNFACIYESGMGCFNISENLDEVEIGKTPYCERMALLVSEAFRVGAWVKKGTTAWSPGLLKMSLYDTDGIKLGECDLPEPSTGGSKIFCDINYSNEEVQEYYVCLNAASLTDYKTKRENKGENCGFYGSPENFPEENYDYYIIAKAAKFDNIGSFVFNQDTYENQGGDDLTTYVSDYISFRYDGDCSNGCSIPVKFKSYGNLNISVYNLSLRYSSGGIVTTTDVYDASKKAAKINSDFIQLDLSYANFSVPSSTGNKTFILYLDGEEILRKKISIKELPLIEGLSPTTVPANIPVEFIVDVFVPQGRNISVYEWDFGDGESDETFENQTTHTYTEEGEYELTIGVEDDFGYRTYKTFVIRAVPPITEINSTLSKYKARLSNLTIEIEKMSSWYKNKIKEILDIDGLTSMLADLERQYNTATSEETYLEIAGSLLDLEIPVKISETNLMTIPFFVKPEDINLEYLASMGAGSYNKSDPEGYLNAIASWAQNNLDMSLKEKHVYAIYEDRTEGLLSIFELSMHPKEESDSKMYVLISEPDVIFSSPKDIEEFDDSTGVKFPNVRDRTLKFAIEGAVRFDELEISVSPEFYDLDILEIEPCNFNGVCEKEKGENWRNCRADCKPWGTAIILLVILFFLALIAYIFMQWWYKEKYEHHLFKNRNDLYNLMNFVSNARSQGLSDNEIKSKLKEVGWSGEQISYVLRKIEGKAIMPLDFLKLFKKSERLKLKTQQPAGRMPTENIYKPGI